jgi:hypothetical protein
LSIGITQLDAIERELGLSRERVRLLEHKALAQLAVKLEDVVDTTMSELAEAA